MEYGPEALVWNKESKLWQTNPAIKLSPPAGLKNPFTDEDKFPIAMLEKEDGTIIKGVPRDYRRTVIWNALQR